MYTAIILLSISSTPPQMPRLPQFPPLPQVPIEVVVEENPIHIHEEQPVSVTYRIVQQPTQSAVVYSQPVMGYQQQVYPMVYPVSSFREIPQGAVYYYPTQQRVVYPVSYGVRGGFRQVFQGSSCAGGVCR